MNTNEHLDQEMNHKDEHLEDELNQHHSQEEEVLSEESEELDEIKKLEYEVADLKEKYLRLYSDFENYRKRTAKERLELISTASEDVLSELIPVVDDFERAFKASENEGEAQNVREGKLLVFNKFLRILESKGLKPMVDQIGKPFDADTQEAISQIPVQDEEMKGKVVDVVEKGYTLGEKVVRYAKVVTGA